MKSQLIGHYIPGDSPLHKLDPRAKFFGFLIMIVAVILAHSLWEYILVTATVSVLVFATRLSPGTVLSSVRHLWLMFVIVFLMNAFFFSTNEAIWTWGIFNLSVPGIYQGFSVVYRIVLIIIMSQILTLTTPPVKIMEAVKLMLVPLRIFRLPVDEIAMILSISIQFIPTIMEETETIRKSQIARGARLDSRKITERAKAMVPMALPVLVASFTRADELATAMEARGYRGAGGRTRRKLKPMAFSGWIVVGLCAALGAAEIFI